MPLLTIPSGTPIMLGTPARPMEEDLLQSLGTMLLGVGGVREAHVPQCFAIGVMDQPAQVLVVVIESDASAENVMDEVLLGLTAILPDDIHLDVWSMDPEHTLLASVQATNCRLM
jgi:hypothetical protein